MDTQQNTQLATTAAPAMPASIFSTAEAFEHAQRMAAPIAKSTIVPKEFQNNIPNVLIALEYANRIGESPMVLMQNMHVINGKPGLKAEYLISRISTSGRFMHELRFAYTGAGDTRTCTAWTTRKNGERLEGTTVSIAMAKGEGWYTRSGSKWPTMPDQMLAYRAAAFFQRLHCPDITFGMQTAEEVVDISHEVVAPSAAVSALNAQARPTTPPAPVTPRPTAPNAQDAEFEEVKENGGAQTAQATTPAAPVTPAAPAGKQTPAKPTAPPAQPNNALV